MSWEQVKGNFNQAAPKIASHFDKLSQEDVLETNGDRAKLESKLQQRYGYSREEAQRKLDELATTMARDQGGEAGTPIGDR